MNPRADHYKSAACLKYLTGPSNLLDAIVSGSLDDVGRFLGPHANVEYPTHRPPGHWDRTPLDMACVMNKLEIVQLLLDHGATVHCRNLAGATPLHGACTKGFVQVVEALILHGADLEAEIGNIKGFTPLWCAVFFTKLPVVLLLLKCGVDVNICLTSGTTPLMEACLKLDHRLQDAYDVIPMVRILIDFGADLAAQDAKGRTAYDIAKEKGNRAVITIMEDEMHRRHMAFAMGEHERVGHMSLISSLKPELVTMILQLVDPSLYR